MTFTPVLPASLPSSFSTHCPNPARLVVIAGTPIAREVKTREQVIVGHVQDAVVAIEIAGNINHLHWLIVTIAEPQVVHFAVDGIAILIVNGVGDDGVEQSHRLVAVESVAQVVTCLTGPAWD